ncbi:MAG TPA: permease prefix domain 1-containing protein [Pirellulales bacterium]|jgi:hypothetical protein|nr:permease prefix domain 1-containing protein [Pirellulales bacterium]
MKALRIQVERVVRPISASYLRKDRMREELLAHLTRLFDEELARSGNPQSATAAAIDRFGDAQTLARELQESVPRLERWAFVRLPVRGAFRRRPGESPLRHRQRGNCWALGLSIVCYAVLALWIAALASRRPHRADQATASQAFALLTCTGAIQFATMFAWGLLNEGIRRGLDCHATATTASRRRQAVWRIVGHGAMGGVLLGAAFAGGMLLIEAFLPVSLITRAGFWSVTLGAMALGLPFTLLQGWSWRASVRRLESWDSLDLDEAHPT